MDIDKILKLCKTVAEDAEPANHSSQWPEKSMKQLGEAGLLGLMVPRNAGGLGQGLYALTKACETLSFKNPSLGLCYGMHCVGSAVIAEKATAYQEQHFLEPIAKGEHITTLALSEPGTGAHFYYPQTQLIVDGDTFLVNGEKSFVTNGGHADSYVISTMAAAPEALDDRFSCLILPAETEGIEWGGPWAGAGMRQNSAINLKMKNLKVKRNLLIGEEGDQLWYVFNVVAPNFLTAMAGTYFGIAHAALQFTINHLKKRVYTHSGSSLAQIPVLQHKVGKLYAEVESTRGLLYNAVRMADTGDENALPALLSSKALVAETTVNVVNECLTLTGGSSYLKGHPLFEMLNDARAAHVMGPTTDILYTWTGRALMEQPILAE